MHRPGERLEDLARLVENTRVELRRWTESQSHDPGVAMLELFAFLGEMLSSYAERVANESYLGTASAAPDVRVEPVEMQRRRVVLDADRSAPTGEKVYGIHRALVVDATDPLGTGRLLVQIPGVIGLESAWAMRCLPPGASAELPSAGDAVWVMFEAGNADSPVWLGRLTLMPG